MIQVDERQLREDLAQQQLHLQMYGEKWFRIEAVARCLHWLNDPDAPTYFLRVIRNYPLSKDARASEHLRVGMLFHLAANQAQALTHFERAYALALPRAQTNYMDTQVVIESCFLLGKDMEADHWKQQLSRLRTKAGMRAYSITKLAQARYTHDVVLATSVVEELTGMIKRDRIHIYNTGAPTLWDWYEIAQDVVTKLSGMKQETERD